MSTAISNLVAGCQ